MSKPFDAVLVVAFGGPQGPADVRPFLGNVLRGRRISTERLEEVVGHYEHFGGVSPLTDITMRQARGLEDAPLGSEASIFPCMSGCAIGILSSPIRCARMAADGVRRAIGLVLAAHRSYSSCAQYRQNVVDARADVVACRTARCAGDLHRRLAHAPQVRRSQRTTRADRDRTAAGRPALARARGLHRAQCAVIDGRRDTLPPADCGIVSTRCRCGRRA